MGIHKIEIIFHEAGTTKNLDLMLSLFADNATLHLWRKDLQREGRDQEVLAGCWTIPTSEPVGRIYASLSDKYAVEGDRAHLYFECLYVDKAKNNIAAHTNSEDALVRVNGKWLIKDMKANYVPEL